MRGGGTLVVKAEDLTIKSIERSEVEERVKVENEVIHFDDYDEYATYTLTLENPTSTKLQVTNINLTNNECVSINTDNLNNTIVDANSTKEVTLTLTSNKCNVNQDNTALLSFKSKEYTEDKKEEEKEDIVSPNTYGNISIFLVVLFILTAIYISLYIYSKKKLFKYLKLSTIIYLSLLIITTITYTIMTSFSANEESLSLTFSYTYNPRRVLMRRNVLDDKEAHDEVYVEDEDTFWENYGNIKKLYIQNKIEEPSSYEEVYDASMNQDESILVYKIDAGETTSWGSELYDLYIMADGEIFTNVDSEMLFGYTGSLKQIVGLENLNTSMTENMSYMFNMTGLENLNLSTFNVSNVTDMSYMFVETNLKNINFTGWDTSNVTNMSSMFAFSNSDILLDLSSFDTSNVTDMSSMFSSYSSSAPLDLSSFDTSKVISMRGMFNYFGNEETELTIDLSHLDTSNVTDMSYMFSDYRSSAPLDLSHFNTSKVTDMSYMFSSWNSTADLDISSINFTTLPQYMFGWKRQANKIYVANDTVKNLLKNSGWPYMTDENIIVKTN